MHANLLAQSDSISGEELRAKGSVVGTLSGVEVKEMEKIGKPGEKTRRGVFRFAETGSKPWTINKTNVEILKTVFGEGRCGKQGSDKEHVDGKCVQTDHWLGHKVALGATDQRVGGERVDGIVVIGCSVLTSPLDVVVKLRSKAARTYTVNPPRGGKPTAPTSSDLAKSDAEAAS